MIKKMYWFVKQSLFLDYRFFSTNRWSLILKIEFIFIKYYLIIKHFFVRFELGVSNVNFGKSRIYYDSAYGLAGYQSMLTRQKNLLSYTGLRSSQALKIFDVGANVGFYTLMCKDLFPKSKIHAFEPIPDTFKCLRNNCSKYTNIKVNNLGMSSKEGVLKMSFDPNDSAVSQISKTGNVEVELTTIDKYFSSLGFNNLDLLKIDTEGFESLVLDGAPKTLAKTRYLAIEITLEDNKNYTLSSLLSKLYSPDYDFDLVAFRNYSDKGEGPIHIMDALFVNKKLS